MRMSEQVARRLLGCVESLAARPEECARSPGRDFVRNRRLGLARLLLLLVCWGRDCAYAELCDLAGWDGSAPSGPALTQQWAKLNDRAMPALLRSFLALFGPACPLGRYRPLAADGTEWQLLPGTGGDRCRVGNGRGGRSHWEMHATCAFDLLRRTFEDVVCQGGAEEDEPGALCRLVDRLRRGGGAVPLWLADRNFCTWNVVCHMADAGASFCLRAKDSWVDALLRSSAPAGEFDLAVVRCLTRSRARPSRTRPDAPWLYRELLGDSRLDALPPGSRGERWVALRVVRLRLPAADGDGASGDRWLNLVTDLPRQEFDAAALAALYAMRWDEETGFLHLKHAVGLDAPRTRDFARAVQELWGRLVLYDACSLGTAGVPAPAPGPGHPRATDRAASFKAFLRYLRSLVREASFDVEACCARMSHSVRRGRSHERRKRPKSPPRSQHRH